MRDYDRLPGKLRHWLSQAALPWRPKSAERAYKSAILRTSDGAKALCELDLLQERLLTKDIPKVWGSNHPDASKTSAS